MNARTKQILAIIALILIILIFGIGVVLISQRAREEAVPTAPESRPQAADWVGGAACNTSFTIAAVVTPTPTATPTAAPVAAISCDSKQAYRNESSNTAGNYTLTQTIDTIAQDDTFVYRINVRNTGTGTAAAVTVTDRLNGEHQDLLTYLDGSTGCTYAASTRTVTCNLTNVAAGATASASFRTRLASNAANGQVVKNTATVTYGTTTTTCSKDLTVAGVVSCNNTCTTDAQCSSGLVCSNGSCRNSACTTQASCVCPTATPSVTIAATATPTATIIVQATPTATPTAAPAQLPEAGISLPTLAALGGGVLMVLLGILFAL